MAAGDDVDQLHKLPGVGARWRDLDQSLGGCEQRDFVLEDPRVGTRRCTRLEHDEPALLTLSSQRGVRGTYTRTHEGDFDAAPRFCALGRLVLLDLDELGRDLPP